MKKNIRYVGLDVHAETIAVAVAEVGGEVRSLGTIPNRLESVRRLVKKLGVSESLRVCYEAGPTGYVLYWQLSELGVACEVVAPSLVPTKPGDRVKTDRRDAEKLARSYRSGDLTAVWVPDGAHEALRDLVRAREAATQDRLRAQQRLKKFLLRRGQRAPEGIGSWTLKYHEWMRAHVRFDHPAQDATFWTTSARSSMPSSAFRDWRGPSTRRWRVFRSGCAPSSMPCNACEAWPRSPP